MAENTEERSPCTPIPTEHSQVNYQWLHSGYPPFYSSQLLQDVTNYYSSLLPYSDAQMLKNSTTSMKTNRQDSVPNNNENQPSPNNSFSSNSTVSRSCSRLTPPLLEQHLNFGISKSGSTRYTSPNSNTPVCKIIDSDPNSLLTASENDPVKRIQNNDNGIKDRRESNFIFQILQTSFEGQFQLAAYDFEQVEENKRKLLDTKHTLYFSKNKVAKLVIGYEFHRTKFFSISTKRFEELARLCTELFPAYLPESFYSPSSKIRGAGGALYTFYISQREKELAIGRIKLPNKRKKPEEDEIQESTQLKELQNTVGVIDDDLTAKWISTLHERQSLYKSDNLDINLIFKKYPILTNPLGYQLIQSDFSVIFGKSSDSFCEIWPEVAENILLYAKKTRKSKADQILKDILQENAVIEGSAHKQILALMILPYLFKRFSKQTARSKGKAWNPEKAEIAKSFIYHLKESENVQASLSKIRDEILQLHNDHMLIVRPYIIIYGPKLSNISAAYVIIGSYQYQLTSVPLAVDICFQSFKVFHESYPIVCNHIWQFLQKKVYQFNCNDFYAAVTTLLEKIS